MLTVPMMGRLVDAFEIAAVVDYCGARQRGRCQHRVLLGELGIVAFGAAHAAIFGFDWLDEQ